MLQRSKTPIRFMTYLVFVMTVNLYEVALNFSVQAGHDNLETEGRVEHALVYLIHAAISQRNQLFHLETKVVFRFRHVCFILVNYVMCVRVCVLLLHGYLSLNKGAKEQKLCHFWGGSEVAYDVIDTWRRR